MDCMKKCTVILAVAVAAGCISWLDVPSVEDCKSGERYARYDHREIRLRDVFGLKESMLTDTNQFPMANGEDYFSFELESPIEGLDEASYSFSYKNGKPVFDYMMLTRLLDPDATDSDLMREYRKIIQWVAEILGVEVECRGLDSANASKMSRHRGGFKSRLDTDVTTIIELAEGYEVHVRASEASYVKRDGDYILAKQASVGFQILHDGELPFVRRFRDRHRAEKKMREVSFGPNLTKKLSDTMRDEAGLSDAKDKELRELRRLIKAAEDGDVDMMNRLAEYHFGMHVKSDPALSFKYSKMAAENGDARGIANLAKCYGDGRGTEKCPEKAAELFRRSAQLGNVWAMYRYGKCLAEGIGVKTNTAEAVKWFTKARECLNEVLEKFGSDPTLAAAIGDATIEDVAIEDFLKKIEIELKSVK